MGADCQIESRGGITRVGNVLFGADGWARTFLEREIPGYRANPKSRGLCIIGGADIIAAAVFDNFNGVHVEASIAAVPKARWATRRNLNALFFYPFETLGVRKITVSVAASNAPALKMDRQLGFEEEARVKFAAYDGSDLIIMQMTKQQCRWLNHGSLRRR